MKYKVGDRVRVIADDSESKDYGNTIGSEGVITNVDPGSRYPYELDVNDVGFNDAELKLIGTNWRPSSLIKGVACNSKGEDMNVVKRIKNLTLSKETRLLRKYELIDDSDNLTYSGMEVIWEFLAKDYRAQLVEKATLLETEDKKNKS